MSIAKLPDAQTLVRQFEDGKSMAEIGRNYGVTRAAVSYKIRTAGYSPFEDKYPPVDVGAITDDYTSGMTLEEVAEKHSLSSSRVYSHLRKAGVKIRRSGPRVATVRQLDEDRIVSAYTGGETVRDITAEHETTEVTIRRILRKHGVYDANRDRNLIADDRVQCIVDAMNNGATTSRASLMCGASRAAISNMKRRGRIARGGDGKWVLCADKDG